MTARKTAKPTTAKAKPRKASKPVTKKVSRVKLTDMDAVTAATCHTYAQLLELQNRVDVIEESLRVPAAKMDVKANIQDLEQRLVEAEAWIRINSPTIEKNHGVFDNHIAVHNKNMENIEKGFKSVWESIDTLESRERLRDKSHDTPVSNETNAVGGDWRTHGAAQIKRRWPWWWR